ncbi:FliH/SctL family protein [Fodinicurvata sediminis]|uniref:FliH/SctL family protein n=1 Tax=Fodinicurvata sediminis TaxID=1121832 RepID=UPI0003B37AF7|nr:FliH/SctL family protein [Fodinicurvata sediminis]
MTAVRKFLFENSFDAPAQPEEPAVEDVSEQEEIPPAPQHSEEELAEARREAYQAGLEAGREQALVEQARDEENRLTDTLAQLSRQLGTLDPQIEQSLQRARTDAVRAGILVVQKLFPRLVERQGDQEVRGLLEDSLMHLMEEPRVVIRVHDSQLDALRGQMEQIKDKSGYEGKTVLLADQEVRPGDIRIEWADGGVERDSERAWQEIGQLIEHTLVPQADAAAAPDAAPTSDPATGADAETAPASEPEDGTYTAQYEGQPVDGDPESWPQSAEADIPPTGETLAPAYDSQDDSHPQDAEPGFAEERN